VHPMSTNASFRGHAATTQVMMHPAMNMVIDHVPESGAQSITAVRG